MSEDGFDLSFKIAKDFALCYPRLDILLYVSANNIKRIAGARRLQPPEGAKDTPCLVDRLESIQKRDWIIRTLRDKFQYTFLVGTNFKGPFDWRGRGFYDVKSSQGQHILDKANYTKEQVKKKYQPPLTGLMQSTSDIPHLELSERKRFGGLGGYVKDAVKGQLRKFIT